MKHAALFLLLAFGLPGAFAKDKSNRCDDVLPAVCAPKNLKDGTGAPGMPDRAAIEAQIEKSAESLKPGIREAITGLLPQYPDLKRKLLSVMNPQAAELCKIKGADAQCLDILAIVFTDQLYERAQVTVDPTEAERLSSDPAKAELQQDEVFRMGINMIADEHTKAIEPTKKQTDHTTDLMKKIKKRFGTVLERVVPDEATRAKLYARISAVGFTSGTCNNRGEALNQIYLPSAHYNVSQNELGICKGTYLPGTSDFELVYMLAHELAHSIDPCVIQAAGVTYKGRTSSERDLEYPIPIAACLRDSKSIGAKYFGADPLPAGAPLDCSLDQDQLSETTSDWFAGEVMGEFLKSDWKDLSPKQVQNGYSNSMRFSCDKNAKLYEPLSTDPLNSHPATSQRMNRILLAVPEARARMDCPPLADDRVYCSGNTVSTGAETKIETETPAGVKSDR